MSSEKPTAPLHPSSYPTDPASEAPTAHANSQNSRGYQEKRDFIRMRIDSPVQVLISGESERMTGICRDLSGGGMLIEVPTPLPPGTEVEVTLESSHGHAPMLRATAVVTRLTEGVGDQSHNRVGLQLKDILL